MTAVIVSLEDWRETRNSQAALARWALRLRMRIKANRESDELQRQSPLNASGGPGGNLAQAETDDP